MPWCPKCVIMPSAAWQGNARKNRNALTSQHSLWLLLFLSIVFCPIWAHSALRREFGSHVGFAFRCRNKEQKEKLYTWRQCRRTKVIVLRKMIYLTFLFGVWRRRKDTQNSNRITFTHLIFVDIFFSILFSSFAVASFRFEWYLISIRWAISFDSIGIEFGLQISTSISAEYLRQIDFQRLNLKHRTEHFWIDFLEKILIDTI